MRFRVLVVFAWAVILQGSSIRNYHGGADRHIPFLLAVQVVNCDRRTIHVSGVSNLPQGAIVSIVVTNFKGDGWQDDSEVVFVATDTDGFFQSDIHPKPGIDFHHNSVLRAYFAPYHPRQPGEVLRIVGRKGENLGGLKNPQVFQVSGPNYGLETIARVTNCGEGIAGQN